MTHFLQQGHSYSKKAMSPNSATPCGHMGANYSHTATSSCTTSGCESRLDFILIGQYECCPYVSVGPLVETGPLTIKC